MYPLAVVPFSYVTTFIFSDDTTAQITTLFVHFVAGGLYLLTVFVLQLIPITAVIGDNLRYIGLIVPSFCVTHAIMTSQNLSSLVDSRNSAIAGDYPDLPVWPDDLWDWANLKADLFALIMHFVLGLMIVAIVESPLSEFFKDCCKCCVKPPEEAEDKDLDDDVIREVERVA